MIAVSGVALPVSANAAGVGSPSESPDGARTKQRQTAETPASEPAESAISVAALVGFGFGEKFKSRDFNPFGLGYGARGGYTFRGASVYLGGTLLKYSGGSGAVGRVDALTLDAEIGYDFELRPFIVRPFGGFGALLGSVAQEDNAGSSLYSHVLAGLLAQYRIAFVTLGAEARYEIASGWTNAGSLLGSLGVRF